MTGSPDIRDSARKLLVQTPENAKHVEQNLFVEDEQNLRQLDGENYLSKQSLIKEEEGETNSYRTQQWNQRRQSVTIQVTPVEEVPLLRDTM